MKLASSRSDPVVSSMFFITAQFVAQIILGAYFVSKDHLNIENSNIKYAIIGGIVAAFATFLFFLGLQQAPLSKIVPIVNLSVVVGVLLSVIFLKEEMNVRIVTGVILAIISIYLITNSN